MLGSNHATDWRPVNGVVSTEDPGNPESVVAITSSIHAMETGVNHPPYKSPLDLTENFTLLIVCIQSATWREAQNFGNFWIEISIFL